MKYQHVVFDIDGTLTDTYLPVTKALIDTVYCLTGKRYQMEEILFAFGIPGEISLKRLGVQDSKAGLQMWNTLLEKKYSHEIVLFEGVTKMLASLADAGVALGIITSKTREEYVASFAAIYPSTAQYFQTVITIDDTLEGKPDPAPMKEYLRRTRALAGKVLFMEIRCMTVSAAWAQAWTSGWRFGEARSRKRWRWRHIASKRRQMS